MQMQALMIHLSALGVLVFASAAASAPDGNEILARAGQANGLNSYSVPVHFAVRMHRPISIRTGVEGVVYYKAPAQSGLQITKLPGPLAGIFKTSYAIDFAAQVWPSKYRVTSVSESNAGGTDVYVLRSLPKVNDPSIDHVDFTVAREDSTPQSVVWYYNDGSAVHLTIENGRMSGYALPASETITVTMPSYALDATATYGTYQINAPVPTSTSTARARDG